MDAITLVQGLAFVLATTGFTLAIYFLMRTLAGRNFDSETKDLASSVIFRVAGLHALILALVFAQENNDYNRIRKDLVDEATAIADIYNDIRRYGTDTEAAVQTALSGYTRVVVEEEWDRLAREDLLSATAWKLREDVYQALLDLVPQTPRQESLRNHMIMKIQLIAEFRQERQNSALSEVNGLFWFAALAGIVLVTVPYFVFPPTKLHLALLSIYGAFTGIIMFITFAFSDPYSQPGRLEPVAFQALLRTEIGGGS